MKKNQNAAVPFLRQFRVEAGLTQAQLSELADVDEGTVKRIEYGFNTRVSTLKALAAALGKTVSDLVGDEVKIATKQIQDVKRF